MSEGQKKESVTIDFGWFKHTFSNKIRIGSSFIYDLVITEENGKKHYFIKDPNIEGRFLYDGWFGEPSATKIISDEPH